MPAKNGSHAGIPGNYLPLNDYKTFIFLIHIIINQIISIMKKLFTLLAFLTLFMGAKAANWVEVYSIDYSQNTGFPFYVMGYVPEWFDGVMTDFGANYGYVEVKDDAEETSDYIVTTQGGVQYYRVDRPDGSWHQYFIADGIKTNLDGTYKVVAMVKASEAVSINVNMGWGWGDGQQTGTTVAIGTDWAEVEWEYSGIAGNSCNLVAQPGGATATIEWKYLKVYEDQAEVRPVQWQEWLTNDGKSRIIETTFDKVEGYMGNAETPWGDLAGTKFNDQEKNYLICAWSKERMVNQNDDGGWDPFPATIEEENGNHYYVVHGKEAITEGDAAAWDNQFWIQSPKEWKSGTQLRIHFRYKASKDVTVATQCHKQNPSDYLIWHAIGDVKFTTEWQEFDDVMTIADDMAGTWSIAFQLNQNDKDAIDFYFDDLSWESMVLDEGLFVAASNTATGIQYQFDTAAAFEVDPEDASLVVATVGEVGKQDSWVNEVMISTIRGNDAAFKGATIKPEGTVTGDPDEWLNYKAASLAKIKLPAAGVWKISIDQEAAQINFVKLEGEENKEPEDIVTNTTNVVVKGQERDWLVADNDGNPQEAEIGTGQPWDNQFFLVANRDIDAGEVTVIKFKYKSSIPATSGTQCHANPGGYIHWAAIGSFNFTEEWQDFETTFTVPSECAGKNFHSIAFNMAEIKAACDYELKDFQWYVQCDTEGKTTENLINAEGTSNFYVKEGAGTDPHEFVDDPAGIRTVSTTTSGSAVVYNLAGQRVTKDYKGIVVKSGKKFVVK